MTSTSDKLFLNVWLNDTNNGAADAVTSNSQFTSIKGEAEKTSAKKPKKIPKKKQPDDGRPRRALTSYNLFFKMERKRIMVEQKELGLAATKNKRNPKRVGQHANVGFGNLARIVSERWRNVPADEKRVLDDQAHEEKERYAREMEEWTAKMKEIKPEADNAPSDSNDHQDNDDQGSLSSKNNEFNSNSVFASAVTPDASPKIALQIPVQTRYIEKQASFPAPPFYEASQDPSYFCTPCGPTLQECEPPTRRVSDIMSSTMMYSNSMIPSYSQNRQVHYPSNNNNYAQSNEFVEEYMCGMDTLAYDMYNSRGYNPMMAERATASSRYANYYDMHQTDYSGMDHSMEEIDDIMRGLRSNRKNY